MSAEWTADRLDALPPGTVIELSWGSGKPDRLLAEPDTDGLNVWVDTGGNYDDSAQIADAGSIRVVSVPVDALLSEGALKAAAEAQPLPKPYLLDSRGLRAAIAHVIGDEPK